MEKNEACNAVQLGTETIESMCSEVTCVTKLVKNGLYDFDRKREFLQNELRSLEEKYELYTVKERSLQGEVQKLEGKLKQMTMGNTLQKISAVFS